MQLCKTNVQVVVLAIPCLHGYTYLFIILGLEIISKISKLLEHYILFPEACA